MSYRLLRNIHLLCGVIALPFLLMYGVSAVQMAHSKWFRMRPVVTESQQTIATGLTDAKAVARSLRLNGDVRDGGGTPPIRVLVPGLVHEIRYDAATGVAQVKTSRANAIGMLNRLHHAAGLWPDYLPLKLWGVAIGLVSLATLVLAATGIWMWWIRRQDRLIGLLLIGANVAFALILLVLIRSSGP